MTLEFSVIVDLLFLILLSNKSLDCQFSDLLNRPVDITNGIILCVERFTKNVRNLCLNLGTSYFNYYYLTLTTHYFMLLILGI